MASHPIIGHVHLKVSDLERAVKFYSEVLAMELQQRYGSSAAFLSYGGYHHHLGLNVWESKNGTPPSPGSTGLFHSAALKRVVEMGVAIDGAADHGVSEAIYFRDPDQNGIEIYWDRPQDQWPRKDGEIAMVSDPLDLRALLAELE
jgi:catechol 2,3-dioxygenase